MTAHLNDYTEVRAYLEKDHPDWLRALTPRHINAQADYWPRKVLAVSSVNGAMQDYVSILEHQTKPNQVTLDLERVVIDDSVGLAVARSLLDALPISD